MSIFTTERIARLLALARARKAWLGASALVFLLVSLGAWALLAPWTAQENYRTLAVAALSEETRVLVFGTSHVDVMLDPRRIDVPAMNLSADICSYVCLESIVAGHVDRLPGLELVLVEADIVSLIYDTFETYGGDHRRFLDLAPSLEGAPREPEIEDPALLGTGPSSTRAGWDPSWRGRSSRPATSSRLGARGRKVGAGPCWPAIVATTR